MATVPDDSALTKALLDDEPVDPEPSLELELSGFTKTRRGISVGLVEGSAASLSREIHTLRRRRLGSAALFLTAVCLGLFLWNLIVYESGRWFVSVMILLRFAIAALCGGVLASRINLTPARVRMIEYVLFGSFTLILVVAQYVNNLDLMHRHDIPTLIANTKNGVVAIFALMVVYGMFIPNDARSTAKVVLTMALATLAGAVLLAERADVADVVEQLRTVERAGSNALFLIIGAALAIYGTYVLNGLRTELHDVRKFGQYVLREKIGVGGMGEVYLAEHELLKRPCALKLIKPAAGADRIALARFEREVQSAARLSHPNTIEIYDYGHTDDGTFYYVMEFLPGMSVQDLVQKYGPMPAGRVIYLFRQVCAGLAEAHSLGLIHRDLKPANIYVAFRGGEPDVAKVLDFGLVKPTRDQGAVELTTERRVSGTPAYMAPEQATGERALDTRADIYAVGALLFFALTGRPPFVAPSAFEVMMAHARDPVVPPSQIRPDVPADLEHVVLRCLAKNPDARLPNIKAVASALASCSAATDWDLEKANAWWAETSHSMPAHAGA